MQGRGHVVRVNYALRDQRPVIVTCHQHLFHFGFVVMVTVFPASGLPKPLKHAWTIKSTGYMGTVCVYMSMSLPKNCFATSKCQGKGLGIHLRSAKLAGSERHDRR